MLKYTLVIFNIEDKGLKTGLPYSEKRINLNELYLIPFGHIDTC